MNGLVAENGITSSTYQVLLHQKTIEQALVKYLSTKRCWSLPGEFFRGRIFQFLTKTLNDIRLRKPNKLNYRL